MFADLIIFLSRLSKFYKNQNFLEKQLGSPWNIGAELVSVLTLRADTIVHIGLGLVA